MKKIALLISSLLCAGSMIFGQKQLNSFEELMTALNSGKQVKMVMHYAKCQLISDNEIGEKVPEAIGGMTIDVYEYFEKGAVRNDQAFVVFSESKLIQYPKGDGYVYNYVKVNITADNKVKITAEYLNPVNYCVMMTENFFTSVNDSINDGGVTVFATE
jgi:hypothetical protein